MLVRRFVAGDAVQIVEKRDAVTRADARDNFSSNRRREEHHDQKSAKYVHQSLIGVETGKVTCSQEKASDAMLGLAWVVSYNGVMMRMTILCVVTLLLVACGGEGGGSNEEHPEVADFRAFVEVLLPAMQRAFAEPFELYNSGNALDMKYKVTDNYTIIDVSESTSLVAPFTSAVRVEMTEKAVGAEVNSADSLIHELTFEKQQGKWLLISAFEKVPKKNFSVDILNTHGYDEVHDRIRTAVDEARTKHATKPN